MAGKKKSQDGAEDTAPDAGQDTMTASADEVVMPEPGAETPETPEATDLEVPEHDPRPEGEPLATPVEDAEVIDPVEDTIPAEDPEPAEAAVSVEPAAPVHEPAPPPAPAKSRGGFFPALFGGIVAAAIGFGAAWYMQQQSAGGVETRLTELSDTQASQGSEIAGLKDTVAKGPDLSGLSGEISALSDKVDGLSARVDEVSGGLAPLQDRITALEKRPISEGVSKEAIAAYEAELARLQQAMADQRKEVEDLIAEAQQMEADASATAETTLRRAALTRILSALDSGTGFAGALGDLQAAGQQVPEELAAVAESGVTSMSTLRDTFPEAARRALEAVRAAEDGGISSVGDFLRTQLGARSLEPREGNDPDAILSRAEAALKAGRLGDTLAELDTLPDAGRAEMANWIDSAAARHKAVTAAEDLSAQLNAG
ncbi:hypothetical protein GLS40_02545 [Pseudooceanicola sp. 216_PA32_1]|uniref:Inner membrane protein n=1 Tax=Pseudooceanicola pacificus TaxID=2676438 RepID=A0A844WBX8_9RHOB|nr:hypothetical protein [Pseudooceanicola pacificus]MWB76900.1 hypothetical protein [Pseudooceanicola pacificus]